MELSAVISQAIADVDVFAERAASMVRYSAYCAEIEASLAAAEREKAEKVRRGELPAVEIDGRPFYLQGLTLAVPAGAFRHVIGRGGENIKRMSANAGGRIRLIELQTSDYFKFKKFAYNVSGALRSSH